MNYEKYIIFLRKNNYSKNTITTYENILKKYAIYFHNISLLKKQLKKYFEVPNTAWTHYNVICSYMKWSNDKRLNKMKELKLPKIPKKYMEVFTKEYLYSKTEINSFDDEITRQKKITLRFLFETGLRASELFTVEYINEQYIRVLGKGNKIRDVLHNNYTTINMKPFLYTTKTLRLWVKEILGKEFTPHSIRRSFATHMLIKGANPKMVMSQLGHEKIETTFRYLNLSLEENWKIYSSYL
ncbi:tyrosine-type recombinase/integrase [Mesoplasma tabanidae]|uniref:Integrase n=1 Tax=Mesoplasma tabanidae TaxID=219745 RepID=A0A2K8P5V6_9MOLU|nr:site-specific integrase [Mesoplasma tabanidae]ATZ21520.1 integrase [Mesoplasma tabanidae]